MKRVLLMLVLVAMAGMPRLAGATDLSGVWQIDEPAWREQIDKIVASMLARMPPEMVAQLKAQGVDPGAMMADAAGGLAEGTIEFLPGGIVRTTSPDEGTTEDARWQLDGDQLRVDVDESDGMEGMVGEVAGDRITLRPILDRSDPDTAMLQDLVFPLVRR
jgi:hypothetical protein